MHHRLPRAVVTVGISSFLLTLVACRGTHTMSITRADFGTSDSKPVSLYTLTNDNGLVAKITDYGGIVTELYTPDRDGKMADVALGFETLDGYVAGSPYFGAIVGRVGNRIGNRIAEGRFTLDRKDYQLATNNGPNHLHGGVKGFDKVVWNAESTIESNGPALKLTYSAKDGEENYPGNLDVTVVYTLTNANELAIDITATADAATPINIVHHTYWNLAGHDAGDILGHELKLNADTYTPTDQTLIPTGAIDPVAGTPFDFRKAKTIGADIGKLPGDGADDPGGYDLNYVLNGRLGKMKPAATVRDPASGRVMEIRTTEPGVQFYSGNFLNGLNGKGGTVYKKHHGFCLETQHYPDSINNEGKDGWPTMILRPGQTYRHTMIHRFTTD